MHPPGCGAGSWESDHPRLYYCQTDPGLGSGSATGGELPGRHGKGFAVSDQQTSCYMRKLKVWEAGAGPSIPVQTKTSFSR